MEKVQDQIEIIGAQVNNLKNVNLKIKLGQITCFMGPSGSGKSSLAFHTLYAESKRRFLNSLPSFLKFFSERPAPVRVESIKPLIPVFALPQSNPIMGARTQVADLLGITDRLGKLFFYGGAPTCPRHGTFLHEKKIDQKIQENIKNKKIDGEEVFHFLLTKYDYLKLFSINIFPVRSFDGNEVVAFDPENDFYEIFRVKAKSLGQAEEKLRDIGNGKENFQQIKVGIFSKKSGLFFLDQKKQLACPKCDYFFNHSLISENFSPLTAAGACKKCNGFGATLEFDRAKIVKNPNLSIEEGAVGVFQTSKYARYLPSMKRDLKAKGFDPSLPFKQHPVEIWEALEAGSKSYPGLKQIFAFFESKKYKKSIRILTRSLQSEVECLECHGSRILPILLKFKMKNDEAGPTMESVFKMQVGELLGHLHKVQSVFKDRMERKQWMDVMNSLAMASELGLSHLQVNRRAKTLSSGEYQRLLLVKYFCFQGSGSLFVFDEPSLGLGEREQKILMKKFREICQQGNTVVIVEHSPLMQNLSDEVVEFGPKAGHLGGEIVYQGKPRSIEIKNITAKIVAPNVSKAHGEARVNQMAVLDLPKIDLVVQKGRVNLVRGPSGVGKTSYFVHGLGNLLSDLLKLPPVTDIKGSWKSHVGFGDFEELLIFTPQSNKFTSRSSVGSLTGLSGVLRQSFAKTPMAASMGLKDGHFSFNSELGQCPECNGSGKKIIEMQFLEDVVIECEHCKGMRLNPLYGQISNGIFTVNQAFNQPVDEVLGHFKLTPKFKRIYELMKLLGLSYLGLNRDLTTLSGGEKQRISILGRMGRKVENALIVLENLSFGLSHHEMAPLVSLLQDLANLGNTIVLIDQAELWKGQGFNLIEMNHPRSAIKVQSPIPDKKAQDLML